MTNRLRRWLENIALTDPLERQQASMFQWVLLGWIVLAAIDILVVVPPFFGVGDQSQPSGPVPLFFLVLIWLGVVDSLLLLAFPVCALVLLRRGRFKLAVAVATLGLLLTHAIATFNLGITSPSVLVVFQIPIALAGLLASRRLLLTVAGLSIAIIVAVTFLESFSPPLAGFYSVVPDASGVMRSPLEGHPVGLTVGFFIGVTILLTTLLDRFGGALRVALAGSLDRETELQSIRASLEASVAERTTALQTALSDAEARAEEQALLIAEVEQQRAAIKDLSVPVIPVSATVLVMPLVGALDSTRLHQLQEQGLRTLERSSARVLILDITGVPLVDSQVAQGLLMTVQAARLLGADVHLVGIRPEVAQTLVGLGIDLHGVSTFRDLQSALVHSAA